MSSDPEYDEEESHGEGHDEPWLVSYADMMTLLFGFFVLMYSFAAAKVQDSEGMIRVRKELAAHFGGAYITPLEDVAHEIEQMVVGTELEGQVTTKLSPEGLEVTFRSVILFASGEASLLPKAENVIQTMVDMIREKGTDFSVRVEGHTDDVPIATRRFPSNWELSGARASTVIRMFESAGFPADYMVAVGFGEAKPEVPNLSPTGEPLPENRARNRRVVIKVTMRFQEGQAASL